MCDTPEAKKEKGADFIISEYAELFRDIRSIHDRRVKMAQMLFTSFVGLIAYIFSGIILYVKSKGTVNYPIPQSLVWCYSALGITLAVSEYAFMHNMFIFYGASKKQTCRYWKSIHAIRGYFKDMDEKYKATLMMPDLTEKFEKRPRISDRWDWGVAIPLLYHFIFYIIVSVLICPLWAIYDREKGLNISNNELDIIGKSLCFLWPFLIVQLATAGRAMRRYYDDIQAAKEMRPDTMWETKRHMTSKTAQWIQIVIFILSVVFSILFLNGTIDGNLSLWIIAFSVLISGVVQILSLNMKWTIYFEAGIPKIKRKK